MHIRIDLEASEPPTGTISDGSLQMRFDGWLGILQALQQMIERAPEPARDEA